MIRLFNEEVYITSTNSVHNTLYVESFEEIFFGVYQFRLNDSTVIAERVSSYNELPVVTIPIINGNNRCEAPFILRVGKPKVKFNPKNTVFVEGAIEEPELELVVEPVNNIEESELNEVDNIFIEKDNVESDPTAVGSKFNNIEEPKLNVVDNIFIEKDIVESDPTVIAVDDIFIDKDISEADLATYSTLYVEAFEEIFFGVYKFKLNGSVVVVEQEAKYNGDPVVNIPVTTDGNKYEAPFILREGKPKVEFKTANTTFVEQVTEEPELELAIGTVKQKISDFDLLTDQNIVNLFNEDVNTISTNSDNNTLYVESFDEIFFGVYEFKLNGSVVIAEKVAKYNDDPVVNIPVIIEGNKYEAPFILREGKPKVKFNPANTVFVEKVIEESDLNIAVESVKHNVGDGSNVNITYKVDKSDIIKELKESLESDIEKTITLAEQRITNQYAARVNEIERASVNGVRKSQILEVVKDSKAKILAELNNSHGLRKQLRDIAEEASKGLYDPVSSKRFQDQIKKDLTKNFSAEMQQIKRMVSSYGGGGGTNAVQYANGGTMNGNLNIEGIILSGGVDIATIFDHDTAGEVTGTGTAGNLTIWDSVSSVANSVIEESAGIVSINGPLDSVFSLALSSTVGTTVLSASPAGLYTSTGINVNGNTTISGNLSVLGDFTYIDTIVSVTSALSVINHGSGPAIYIEQTGVDQPIAKFVDTEGGVIIFDDGGKVGIGTADPDEVLTVVGNISASGTVRGTNIDTLTNNVSALYSYLVQNFETNNITTATDINDFVTFYSKAGIVTGDVVTISATNTAYILGDNDGSALTDWLEINLKPNYIFFRQGLVDYSTLDTIALSSVKSSKYIVEVSDKSDNAIFYGEISVVSDGTIAVATEYALNHTTIFPFVEFGAEVVSGTHIQLSAVALEGKDMSNFVFKGNRSNLFG